MGVEVTATAAEINKLDGVLDGYIVSGTAQISLIEADVLDGATAGTQVAAKAVVANSDVNIGVVKATELHIGATGSEVQVDATPAELNILDDATLTTAELNTLDNVPGPVVTLSSETGGSGTCAVQVVINDTLDGPMATIVSGQMYFSDDSAGLTIDGVDTSVAVLTNGSISELGAADHGVFQYVTSAAGLLGFTITSAQASYYACFPQPNGSVTVIGPLICDA
jgi:hypothetical protein